MSNIRNPEKPKKKTGNTALQEQCSLIAFYYAYKKGATLNDKTIKKKTSKTAQLELDVVLKKVYPAMKKAWYDTFISQATTLCKYKLCKHTIGSVKDIYEYGWYDGIAEEIPTTEQTTLLPDIWNKIFDERQWKLFGGKRQKDSWNTADVFLVKKGKTDEIYTRIEKMKKLFDSTNSEPGVLVGTVNTILTQYVNAKILIPISLKMKTSSTTMSIKETNMHEWKSNDEIEIIESEFIKDPFMYFNVLERGGKISFGEGPGTRDPGNSLQYFAEFKVGDYNTRYLIEYRLASDGMKGETKDLKTTNKGEVKRATAQTGQVPTPKLKKLTEKYSKEKVDDDIPKKNKTLNEPGYISTWVKYLSEIWNDTTIKKNLGRLNITIGDIDEKYNTDFEGYITKLFEIDEWCVDNPKLAEKKLNTSIEGFPQKIRMKLGQLRVLRAMINAKSKGELNEWIVYTYYLSAKQNISNADLHGPFLKLS